MHESVMVSAEQDEVVKVGFATVSVASFTELFVPHNCCGSSEVEWVAVGINDETSDGASSKKFTPDIDERDVVVVSDEFVETNHDRGRVDGASGFRSPVSSRAAEEARCEVGESIGSAFGECAPNGRIVGVRVAELVERFAHNGGLVSGETAGEHGFTKQGRDERQGACCAWCAGFTQVFVGERREVAATLGVNIDLSAGCGFDEEVAVLVEGFLSTFCSYFCECVEMADGCFTRRVVRPASEAGRLETGRSQPANRGQCRSFRQHPPAQTPPRSS
jgi:hypothetical protein